MTKTWGDIYHMHLRKGEDHGFAAMAADRYCERHNIARPPKGKPAVTPPKRPSPLEGLPKTVEELRVIRDLIMATWANTLLGEPDELRLFDAMIRIDKLTGDYDWTLEAEREDHTV